MQPKVYLHYLLCNKNVIRDWSLITGRGGATKREGGHVKFYPYEMGRGGVEQVLAMLKGEGTTSLGVVLCSSLKF